VTATPDGIASLWRSVKARHLKVLAFAKRQLQRLRGRTGQTHHATAHPGTVTTTGNASAEVWRDWQEDADTDEKIAILHRQVDILRESSRELRTLINSNTASLRNLDGCGGAWLAARL
jgi:hypothetical protein